MSALLRDGELHLIGRLRHSSNNAMVADIILGDVTMRCIYKPIVGERPLWDFPAGTLAGREVAAHVVSELAGWHCVPPTVLRDGPAGPGMVQQWIDEADDDSVQIFAAEQVPTGQLPILAGEDETGRTVVLAHADDPQLRTLAGFDLIVNNADRKGGHVLRRGDRVFGVDHGLTFHAEDKLRTVLWGWAGQPLPTDVIDGVHGLRARFDDELAPALQPLISAAELDALAERLERVAAEPVFPAPPDDRSAVPWPPL